MTKKDYVRIAGILQEAKPDIAAIEGADAIYLALYSWWETLCRNMAAMLERDNPAFNTDRFLKACTVFDE